MESNAAWKQKVPRRARASVAAAVLSICAIAGCAQPQRRTVFVEPAAHVDSEGRRVDIKPPFDLADNYEQAIVRLVADVTCTGTLIAEDLVLTAHHCVVRHDASGHATREEVKPGEVNVELGTSALPWGEVGVRAIVAPDCGFSSGDGDIAVLVLSRKLVGVATIQTSKKEATVGSQIEARGYGRCSGASATAPIELATRQGRVVEFTTPRNYYGVATICRGDSGGPTFMTTPGKEPNERELNLVGVVSASDMGSGGSGFSVFTRVDAWPAIFQAARAIADGESTSEAPPWRSCDRDVQEKQAKPRRQR